MAFLKKSDVRPYASRQFYRRPSGTTAGSILNESERQHYVGKRYDVFLSHAVRDAEIVLGVKGLLEEKGLAVYVDWLEDTQLDRSRVTPETADLLRNRMRACSSLIYIATDNASSSKWMPWELGYFDGYRNNAVAILPVLDDWKTSFVGQEYLGIYPVMEELLNTMGEKSLFTYSPIARKHVNVQSFAKGSTPFP